MVFLTALFVFSGLFCLVLHQRPDQGDIFIFLPDAGGGDSGDIPGPGFIFVLYLLGGDLVPMYFLIAVLGRGREGIAAIKFFIYTGRQCLYAPGYPGPVF